MVELADSDSIEMRRRTRDCVTEYRTNPVVNGQKLPPHGTHLEVTCRAHLSENKSRSGLTGGDAAKSRPTSRWFKALSDFYHPISSPKCAIAVNEHNAKMGLVCHPTAGKCRLVRRRSHQAGYPKIRSYPRRTKQISSLLLVL